MDVDEARAHVDRIWPERLVSLYLRKDGGADVNLQPCGTASDLRGRTFSAHRIDAAGTPTCHTDCMDLAKR